MISASTDTQPSEHQRAAEPLTADTSNVSVVICSYTEQRWDDLVAAVVSLQQQSRPPLEVVVVVDYNAALLARVQRQLTGVTAVANSQVRGLSGARNDGIACSRGALIAFLDDDAVAAPDWLAKLQAHCDDPRVLGVGGWTEPSWAAGRPDWFPDEFLWVVGCTYRGFAHDIVQIRNPFGGCLCIRRQVFDEVGGFDTGLGRTSTSLRSCEETELCIRARQRWPDRFFAFEPAARIHHRVPMQRRRWRYFLRRCYAEGGSKALVSRRVGKQAALDVERAYLVRTLPCGIARGITEALTGRDPAGLRRAGAMVAGLIVTGAGFMAGTFTGRRDQRAGALAPAPCPTALLDGRTALQEEAG